MDLSNIFGDIGEQVSNAWDSAIKNGVPALQSSLEQNALDWLTKQHQATQQVVVSNVKEMMNDPNQSYLGQVVQQAGLQALFEEKGLLIIGAIVAVGVIGYMVMK